jgi:hypothetical protein
MRKLHTTAFALGFGHFTVCGISTGLVLLISFGYGLSDAYHEPVWWFVLIDKTLVFLEAPVALVLRALYHPTARFEPPRLFVVDYAMASQVLVALALCVMWSAAFGYLSAYGFGRFKRAWASSRLAMASDQETVDRYYQGRRCVCCHAPISSEATLCPKCGWTQP